MTGSFGPVIVGLSQMRAEEAADLVKRDDVHAVIQIGMDSSGNDHQRFVVAAQPGKGVLGEIAGMRVFPMDHQHRAADLIAVGEDRHVHERERGGDVPALIELSERA